MWLIEMILDSGRGVRDPEYVMQWFPGDDLFAACRPRGIPIGNLTSQFFANVYLHELDAFVKHTLRWRHYIRYCDDFVLLGKDKPALHQAREEIASFLQRLRLRLHPRKTLVFPLEVGTTFLGYRIYPSHIRVNKANVRRFTQRMRKQQKAYEQGKITSRDIRASVHAWIAHAGHADSGRLREGIFSQLVFQRHGPSEGTRHHRFPSPAATRSRRQK